MKDRQFNIMLARFPYGGTGGTACEAPEVGTWISHVTLQCYKDPRIAHLYHECFSDTPITMTRNAAVHRARELGMDILLMVDSDMSPDCEIATDPAARPFFKTSLDFLIKHYETGPVVIGAPYCGPPPHENVYVFHWDNVGNGQPDDFKLSQFTRHEAMQHAGIQEVGALPTGLIMYDMRCFDYLKGREYFYYEWRGDGSTCPNCEQPTPGPRMKKASTEDVSQTRDISLCVQEALGYNPVYCNWDAWAGHWKPWLVRKPRPTTNDQVGMQLKAAIERGQRRDEVLVEVGGG